MFIFIYSKKGDLIMNCQRCKYSYINILERIEVCPKATGSIYCKLGFPIECIEGNQPKELEGENNE